MKHIMLSSALVAALAASALQVSAQVAPAGYAADAAHTTTNPLLLLTTASTTSTPAPDDSTEANDPDASEGAAGPSGASEDAGAGAGEGAGDGAGEGAGAGDD